MGPAVAQRFHPGTARSARTVEERLLMRFPTAVTRLGAVGIRLLTPRSRLRQQFLRWSIQSGWASTSRRDLDLALTRYASDVVSEWPATFVGLGIPEQVRGLGNYHKVFSEFWTIWADYRAEPEFAIDCGGTLVVFLGQLRATGQTSGIKIDSPFGQVIDFNRRTGLVARDRFFMDWAEALQAAGIDSGFLTRLEGLEPGEVVEVPSKLRIAIEPGPPAG